MWSDFTRKQRKICHHAEVRARSIVTDSHSIFDSSWRVHTNSNTTQSTAACFCNRPKSLTGNQRDSVTSPSSSTSPSVNASRYQSPPIPRCFSALCAGHSLSHWDELRPLLPANDCTWRLVVSVCGFNYRVWNFSRPSVSPYNCIKNIYCCRSFARMSLWRRKLFLSDMNRAASSSPGSPWVSSG